MPFEPAFRDLQLESKKGQEGARRVKWRVQEDSPPPFSLRKRKKKKKKKKKRGEVK